MTIRLKQESSTTRTCVLEKVLKLTFVNLSSVHFIYAICTNLLCSVFGTHWRHWRWGGTHQIHVRAPYAFLYLEVRIGRVGALLYLADILTKNLHSLPCPRQTQSSNGGQRKGDKVGRVFPSQWASWKLFGGVFGEILSPLATSYSVVEYFTSSTVSTSFLTRFLAEGGKAWLHSPEALSNGSVIYAVKVFPRCTLDVLTLYRDYPSSILQRSPSRFPLYICISTSAQDTIHPK